jgi:hypothetical protein
MPMCSMKASYSTQSQARYSNEESRDFSLKVNVKARCVAVLT